MPFEMFNGTRQGCLLSPLLYVLTLEPILATIWTSGDVEGGGWVGIVYKIEAYADDVLFYITKPRLSLPNLIKELRI